MTPQARSLRAGAEALAGGLPPLLAEARQLAATVMLGEHGRRRAGAGDEFWQYRPATDSDAASGIDWRRSARSDAHFVREKEWQAAQSVLLWADTARAMGYCGSASRHSKADRARLLALALALLLVRAGERVGMADGSLPPRTGERQIVLLAAALEAEAAEDYGHAPRQGLVPHAQAVFLSDFMGDLAPLEAALVSAAERGMSGCLLQVLDPDEEEFPFDGRTVFESMGGVLRHETLRAGDLRARYRDRLAARRDDLENLARRTGWHFAVHQTGTPALTALNWLYHALERRR